MSQTKAQLIDPVDGSLVNADINASAAIAGTKISPDFGSQNLVTTGSISGAAGTLTGDLTIPDTIVHTGDTNTKIRFPAADTITAETGGSERIRINSNGAVMVGGTLQAGSNGGLNAEVTSSGNHTTALALINQGTADDSGVIISHRGKDDAGNQHDYNYIRMVADDTGSGSEDGSIRFWTLGAGTLGERLRITSTGNVGIGTTSPSRNLDVVGTLGIKNSSGAQWYVDRNDSNGRFELYQSNGTGNDGRKLNVTTDGQLEVGQVENEANRGRVAIKAKNDDGGTAVNLYLQEVSGGEGYGLGVDAAGDLNFYNSGGTTPSFEIGDDNNVTITNGNLIIGTGGKGIDFSAQTATSATGASTSSEVFDHYEEGTFTPFNPSLTASDLQGHYTRVGRVVHCSIYITIPSNSNGNDFVIDGLPFNTFNPDPSVGASLQGGYVIYSNYSAAVLVRTNQGGDRILVNTIGGNNIQLTNLDNINFRIGLHYFTT